MGGYIFSFILMYNTFNCWNLNYLSYFSVTTETWEDYLKCSGTGVCYAITFPWKEQIKSDQNLFVKQKYWIMKCFIMTLIFINRGFYLLNCFIFREICYESCDFMIWYFFLYADFLLCDILSAIILWWSQCSNILLIWVGFSSNVSCWRWSCINNKVNLYFL